MQYELERAHHLNREQSAARQRRIAEAEALVPARPSLLVRLLALGRRGRAWLPQSVAPAAGTIERAY
jgi:hypothetical protein